MAAAARQGEGTKGVVLEELEEKVRLCRGDVVDGRYEIVRRVARGGMAEVWAVRHRSIGELFAMKLLAPICGVGDDTLSRFALEARISAMLGRRSHHVVPVVDYGVHEGRPFLVMPLLEGPSLEQVLATGPVPVADTVRIVDQIAKALETAHAAFVLHRDLKAGNVMLSFEEGEVVARVTDFGLAKPDERAHLDHAHHTLDGIVLGTPMSMSPEQARGEVLDARCDVWALSCLAYRCLVGRDPFVGRSVREVLLHVVTGEFPPPTTLAPDLPAEFDAVFRRAFRHELDARHATPTEFARALAVAAGAADAGARGQAPDGVTE
jgi:serine/threonine protein kinase